MASPSLHFLGWSRPAVETVCDFLLANNGVVQASRLPDTTAAGTTALLDLEGTLVIVPTRQAGRRLMDELVRRCGDSGAVLSQRMLTPTLLAADALRLPEIAGGAEILAAWSETFSTAAEPLLIAAFGAAAARRDPGLILALAERLQQVRRDLAEAACSCADAAARATAEPERWQALAQLEAGYLARLSQAGLRDPCAAQIAWAVRPQLSPDVRRVVVACVPDPSLLLARAVERLAGSGSVAVEILVQAPADEAAHFDAWGRPLPDPWSARRIEIPDEERNLLLEADPAAQAGRVVEILAAEAARFAVSDAAIGVPDRALVPFLTDQLATHGMAAFDPQERPLREHPLCELALRLLDLRRAAPYRTVADLLRHPDVLAALQQADPALAAAPLLEQLDEFQNRHLPSGLPDLLRPFERHPRGTADPRADFTFLGRALPRVAQWRERLRSERLPVALRALLAEIYAGRTLDPENPVARLFATAAEAIDRALRELEDSRLPPASAESEAAILAARLHSQGCAPERGDERIDLEGWLELPWNRAPLLLVAGMNEGFVPDGRLADDFLPDSLRRALGLRDDRLRAARDAFLLHTLLAARGEGRGRVCLLCGKSSAEGDPLRPSRLLFRCDDRQLPRRAQRLFRPLPPSRPSAPATVGFRLRPFALPAEENPAFPVTRFKEYLRCPFRFHLRHRLQMEPLADDLLAPDERAFGNLVHAALQDFGHDEKLSRETDPDKLAARLAELARGKFAAAYGPRPSLAVQVARESAVQRLERFAGLQAGWAREWEIVACEKRFTLHRGGREIVARIDRIDRHGRDGRLRVMDYKTSEKPRPPEETHLGPCRPDAPEFSRVELPARRGRAQRKAWQDLQLPLYREALRAAGEYDVARLELGYCVLPRAVGETAFLPWADYSDELHASALACADGVLAAIAAGIFWPPRDVLEERDEFAALFVGDPAQCFEVSPVAAADGRGMPADPRPPAAATERPILLKRHE